MIFLGTRKLVDVGRLNYSQIYLSLLFLVRPGTADCVSGSTAARQLQWLLCCLTTALTVSTAALLGEDTCTYHIKKELILIIMSHNSKSQNWKVKGR